MKTKVENTSYELSDKIGSILKISCFLFLSIFILSLIACVVVENPPLFVIISAVSFVLFVASLVIEWFFLEKAIKKNKALLNLNPNENEK